MTPLAVLLTCCLVLTFVLPRATAAPAFDRYDLNVTVKENRLTGRETLSLWNRSGETVSALFFCLSANAYRDAERVAVKEKMSEAYPHGFSQGKTDILRVRVNETDAPFSLEEDGQILSVTVPPLSPGGKMTVRIDFSDVLPDSPARFGKGDDTLNFGNWYPVLCPLREQEKPLYIPFGDPFYSDCADYHLTLRAPAGYRLASSGVIENKNEGIFETAWEVTGYAMRDLAFVLSPAYVLQSRHVGDTLVYVYGFGENDGVALTYACRALACFDRLFGAYPYPTFTLAAADLYIAGMEYPTLVMIDRSLFASDKIEALEETIAHETAHQWWYAAVGSDPLREAWLDEGLAQYATALYLEETYGEERYQEFIRGSETYVRTVFYIMEQEGETVSRAIERPTKDFEHWLLYNAMCYDAPCVMFDALRQMVGRKTLVNGLRAFAEQNQFQTVGKKELIDALSASTGKNIASYLAPWLAGEVYWE